jgi:SAM-dependent methyltransferase
VKRSSSTRLPSGNNPQTQWNSSAKEYKDLIESPDWDSRYLREVGLQPTIVRLVGDCAHQRLLDAGTGTGWLFQHLRAKENHACDLVPSESLPSWVNFSLQNVSSTNYESDFFDTIVSSLVLIWCDDIDAVLVELFRIAQKGGRLILAVMNPYFYRTGDVGDKGDFVVKRNLKSTFSVQNHKIAGRVGNLTYFYHPFPKYINSLIASGWQIQTCEDWFIDIQDYRLKNGAKRGLKVVRSEKTPLYTFFVCIKPAL